MAGSGCSRREEIFPFVTFFHFLVLEDAVQMQLILKREKVRSVEKKVMNKIIIIVIQYTQLSKQ